MIVGKGVNTTVTLIFIDFGLRIKKTVKTAVMRFYFPVRMIFIPGRAGGVFPGKNFFNNFPQNRPGIWCTASSAFGKQGFLCPIFSRWYVLLSFFSFSLLNAPFLNLASS